ncbi:MAG: alpha-ketoglutarate-dependent dioxygenase AlkB family protein [Bacteroidota bacterium]
MLIEFPGDGPVEVLPAAGSARYQPHAFQRSSSDEWFRALLQETPWQQDIIRIFGKTHVTARKFAFYGDRPFGYNYSGHVRTALTWSPVLDEIRKQVESNTRQTFNACLLNLYHNGEEGMGWHSDDEPELDPEAPIASVSLGAERKFSFRNRSDKSTRSILLEHGSLLVMDALCQRHWLHALPKSKRVSAPRINMTFRRMI